MRQLFALTLLLISSWTSCNGLTLQSNEEEEDTIPPQVLIVTPENLSKNIATDINITAGFSEKIDPASVNIDSFLLNGSSSNIEGIVSYDLESNVASFDPINDLNYSTEYTAILKTEIKDITGNSLSTEYSWKFSTSPPPTLNSFTTAGQLPYKVVSPASTVHNEFLYIIGGDVNNSITDQVKYAKLNPDGTIGNWNDGTSLNVKATSHCVALYNDISDFLYVIGGNGASNVIQYSQINSDGSLGTWQTTSSLNNARREHTSIIHNGHIYTIGGFDMNYNSFNNVEYAKINADGSLGQWIVSNNFFMNARFGHTSIIHNNKIYIIGGNIESGNTNDIQNSEISVDGSIGEWKKDRSFITKRAHHSSTLFNNYLYIFGGWEVGGSNTHLDSIEITSFL